MHIYLLIACLLQCSSVLGMSMTYSFRVAEITKPSIKAEKESRPNKLVTLLFDQYQKTYNGIRQNFVGGFASYIYNPEPYYFRVDAALAHIQETINHTATFSETQTDDILLTFGRNLITEDKLTISLSGLCGIPTHNLTNLEDNEFGFCQLATGIQCDGEYALNKTTSLVWGGRYIYFIPRTTEILEQKYRFTNGNIANLLFAIKNSWDKHELETGYTFCSIFEPDIYPAIPEFNSRYTYLGSALYAAYQYTFLTHTVENECIFNLAYGFQHKPNMFSLEYLIQCWVSWSISF